jgi:hypothetical protein
MKRRTCAEIAAGIEALPDKERDFVLSLLSLFEERKREREALRALPARRVLQS